MRQADEQKSVPSSERVDGWRRLAKNGHHRGRYLPEFRELVCHSLFYPPCGITGFQQFAGLVMYPNEALR